MNETVTISPNLANAIVNHLRNGGTYLEAGLLADLLVNEANASLQDQTPPVVEEPPSKPSTASLKRHRSD